jgi:hypothetical protein
MASIAAFERNSYGSALENVPASSSSLFELYRFHYRYWFFVEWGYELLNFVFVTIGERYNRKIYWVNFSMRLLYITTHILMKPSFYPFHNILYLISGCSQLAEDIAVLEDIYGSGVLNRSVWWPMICVLIPILVAIGRLIASFLKW